jgi:hypothetical protein
LSPTVVNSATAGILRRFTGSGDPLGSLCSSRNPDALRVSHAFSSLQVTTGAALSRVTGHRADHFLPPLCQAAAWVSGFLPHLAQQTFYDTLVLSANTLSWRSHQRAIARRAAVNVLVVVTACVAHAARTERHGLAGPYHPLG